MHYRFRASSEEAVGEDVLDPAAAGTASGTVGRRSGPTALPERFLQTQGQSVPVTFP